MQSSSRNQLRALEENMLEVLAPFEYGKDQSTTGFMDLETYRKAKILTQKQCDILEKGDQEWTGPSGNGKTPLAIWLDKYIVHNSRSYTPDNLGGIDFEEADLEYEQIKELEAENAAVDDENGK
jgi:helicase required for RNAi-mediated heterochromatin assembly 1